MQKCLYLLCPTDCLETVINNTFKQENYFYTSLGNSFNADSTTLRRIKCVIQKHSIRKICLVLANDNKIISDALSHQDFSDIKGLHRFYAELSKQQEKTILLSSKNNSQFNIISHYLNKKIEVIALKLCNELGYTINITGKIYDRYQNKFKPICSNLVYLEKSQLN